MSNGSGVEREDPVLIRIGAAAERVGLSIRTLRYWEEVGLVQPSGRTDGGFRLYSQRDLERLLVVKRMKPLDLTLEEMRELFELIEQSTALEDPGSEEGRRVVAGLELYAERSLRTIAKLEAYVEQARELRDLIAERLERLSRAGGWTHSEAG